MAKRAKWEPAEDHSEQEIDDAAVESIETLEQAQSWWDSPISGYCPRAKSRSTLVAPIKPKVMQQWAANDPRPIPVTFFDGKLDERRLEYAIQRGQQSYV
jgi:hypothetical protein